MLRDEASVDVPIDEVFDLQDEGVVDGGGGHPGDDQLIECTLHASNGLLAVLTPHDQLAQQGVIVGWHLLITGEVFSHDAGKGSINASNKRRNHWPSETLCQTSITFVCIPCQLSTRSEKFLGGG